MCKFDKEWKRIARVIGDTVNVKRKELGLSVAKLSQEVGVSPAVIYALEAGDKLPRLENVNAILNAIGAVIVLGGTDKPQAHRVRGFERVKNAPKDIILPTRKTKGSAGYDFYLPCDVTVPAHGQTTIIPTYIKAYMPADEVLLLHIRSSIGLLKFVRLANATGIIDCDYYNNPENEGNIGLALVNDGEVPQTFRKGERIMQGIFTKYGVVDNDTTTGERKGGTGSTGK